MLHIKDKESFVAKSCEENREYDTSGDISVPSECGQRIITEMQDRFEAWVQICHEADANLEQRRPRRGRFEAVF